MQATSKELQEIIQHEIARGLDFEELPPKPTGRDSTVPHAPKRNPNLNAEETRQALKNSLRYFPKKWHKELAEEFLQELHDYGHIYMYRFRPTAYRMRAYPSHVYPCISRQCAAAIHNIMNNLDPDVAQFPHELITYGGNGAVFQNWAQYRLTLQYLCRMSEQQTLVMESGHPQGLYPSSEASPRMVITNGMMVFNYSSKELFEKYYAMGVTMYGQMTAGSYCYIGSQGIVHGTTLTLLGAARKYLHRNSMKGLVFVTSGLGGMSGAQPKAADICGCISVTAEVMEAALDKRIQQGWAKEKITDLEKLVHRVKQAKKNQEAVSIAYLGNIVDVWERFEKDPDHIVDLGSDQTSLHNPYSGGYYPAGLTVEQSQKMMVEDPQQFKEKVHESLRRQVRAINALTERGMRFWDYGNSFLLECSRAKAEVFKTGSSNKFRYPSYVEDIMGDIFELGFGPFRWICTSGKHSDLIKTDKIAEQVLTEMHSKAPEQIKGQLQDNIHWIKSAEENQLVVGSQARILYADAAGRSQLLRLFSSAIRSGEIEGPVVLSRDHHDVSSADSPYRETSSVYDGSMFCADMSVQNFVGDAVRGATWVALHNGGGVGWGEVVNGGFGVVLDGRDTEIQKLSNFMTWDVYNGVSRRAWAGGKNANWNLDQETKRNPQVVVTRANIAEDDVLDQAIGKKA